MTKINFGSSRTDGEEANQTTRNLLSFNKKYYLPVRSWYLLLAVR